MSGLGKGIFSSGLARLLEDCGLKTNLIKIDGYFNEDAGTEDVVVVAETDIEEPERRRRIATDIRQRVNQGSDIALRYVEVVDRMWLVKTSSGKVARNANRDKYLEEFQR